MEPIATTPSAELTQSRSAPAARTSSPSPGGRSALGHKFFAAPAAAAPASPASPSKQHRHAVESMVPDGSVVQFSPRDAAKFAARIGQQISARRRSGEGVVTGRVIAVEKSPSWEEDEPAAAKVTVLVEEAEDEPSRSPASTPDSARKRGGSSWRPRAPKPEETEGHRMVRRRQRLEAEAKELSLRPRPPPPVDMRGWSPADGEAKPLIDEFLRYAPSSGRSALGDMKALERREAELRAQTKEKLEDLRECISTIVQNWDEALAVRIHAPPRRSKALTHPLPVLRYPPVPSLGSRRSALRCR